MLMDNHESHCTHEFVTLANDNHIRLYPLIPHLTHCMQPLDVGVFQTYKHWHDVAIRETIATSFVEYSIPQFLKDLNKMRVNTFKSSTIQHAFQKTGMWPVNANLCIEQLKTYSSKSCKEVKKSAKNNSNHSSLPQLPCRTHPQTPADVEHALVHEWGPKIQRNMQWSDPIRADEFTSFIDNTKEVITTSIFQERELQMWHERRTHELQAKKNTRKRLKPDQSGRLGLTKEDADIALAAKLQKKAELEKKRADRNFMKMWRMERDEMHAKGVAARKQEKARIKQVKEFEKQQVFISVELLHPIHDPEAEWKATNQTWIAEENKKQMAKNSKNGMPVMTNHIEEKEDEEAEEENITFIVDNQANNQTNNQTQLINNDAFQLQKDFMHFDDEKNEKNERNKNFKNLTDIQQQLMQHFDDFEEFDENEDDVQAALNFS